jgi:hypothetical protein
MIHCCYTQVDHFGRPRCTTHLLRCQVPTVGPRPGGGKAVRNEQIIARPDQPGSWKGVSALIAGS